MVGGGEEEEEAEAGSIALHAYFALTSRRDHVMLSCGKAETWQSHAAYQCPGQSCSEATLML